MDSSLLKILLAYGIIMFGPIVGTYVYLKNSNKLIAAAGNMISKAGAKLGNFAGSAAQKQFKRSKYGVAWQDRERALDNQGLTRGRDYLQKLYNGKAKPSLGNRALAGLSTLGMDDRTKRNYVAQLAGQDNEIYRGEVEGYKTQLGREFESKGPALKHYWERMSAPDLGTAEAHALHDHIMSLPGGASLMDDIWAGKVVDPVSNQNIGALIKENKRKGGTAYTGIQRSLLDKSSKFYGGSADISYAMLNRPDDYLSALSNGEQDGFLDTNWDNDKTVTFHNLQGDLVTDAPVIVPADTNGGLTYTGERAKNMGGFGKRLAYAQETSGKMTDEAAGLIAADTQKASQDEHVVYEVAKRRMEAIKANGGRPIRPAENRNPNPPPSTAPTDDDYSI